MTDLSIGLRVPEEIPGVYSLSRVWHSLNLQSLYLRKGESHLYLSFPVWEDPFSLICTYFNCGSFQRIHKRDAIVPNIIIY